MPALPSWLTEPLWDQFAALLPERGEFDPAHPLRCHRRRISDRIVFDKLVQVAIRLFLPGHRRHDVLGDHDLTRILRLTVDDVTQQDGEVSIRLGDPPIPVPEPFAGLLLEHVGHRLNLTTATNTDARWLFPARRGGQPMTPDTIARRLRQHGIPALGGRTAALRQLVLQTPAPVVATMLGYHTSRPPASPPRPAAPGVGTPPAITHGYKTREHATVDYFHIWTLLGALVNACVVPDGVGLVCP
jgi:hypothetical protein